jgi:hypothetical protein
MEVQYQLRPSQETIEEFRKLNDIIGCNIDQIVKDFTRTSAEQKISLGPRHQHIVDVMFTSFVLGMINTMSPDSSFNKDFNHHIGPISKVSV